MDDRTIEEKMSSALSRGQTRYRETVCDLDKVMALALASSGDVPRILGEGTLSNFHVEALIHYRLADAKHLRGEALGAISRIATALDKRHHGRANFKVRDLAESVLDFWADDSCVRCGGLRFEPIRGTPTLSAIPCQQCAGSGKRKKPWVKRLPHRPDVPAQRSLLNDSGRELLDKWERECDRARLHMTRHDRTLEYLDLLERSILGGAASRLR
jgi:hypothetical protein